MSKDQSRSGKSEFRAEVSARFGVLPNFFCSAPAAPGLIEELWAFAKSAYLDSPLPSLFKERLFVHLSRFCEIRYCIIRHVGFLLGEGRPAGDPEATPETVAQALALLRRPVPGSAALDEAYQRLEVQPGAAEAPPPETRDEADLFDALTVIFLTPAQSTRARQAVRHFVGERQLEVLTAFLAFVRTAHYWTETHPDLECEADMTVLMATHPDLAAALLDTSDAQLATAGEELRRILRDERRRAEQALHESETQYRTLFDSVEQGVCIIERIPPDASGLVDFRYIAANAAFEEHTGLHDVVGKTQRAVVPNIEQHIVDSYDAVARTGEPWRFETHVAELDRWFEGEAVREESTGRIVVLFSEVTQRKRTEAALRESEERQAFLLKLADALRTEDGVDAVGNRAVRMIADKLALDRVYFVTADLDARRITVTHDIRREDMPQMLGTYTTLDFPDALKEFLAHPIVYTDVRTDPRLGEHDRSSFASLGAAGFAAVPIRRGSGTLIWAIGAVSSEPREWTAGDIGLLEEAAERSWAAIERARADAALRASEHALAADLAGTSLLRDLADRLVTEEDLATIHEEILSAAMTITGSDAGTVQLYEPATESLVLLVTRGFDRMMTDRFHRIDADSRTACGAALREGRRTRIDFDADETDEAARLHLEAGYRSAQATPLISRAGAPLGMLNTHWRASRHRPSERELHFLDLLARQAADLIERAQAQRQLRESEERLRQFGEASQDVLWIRDAETLQWRYLTPAFETIYGLDREEALAGNNYRGWLDLIVPEDRERAESSISWVRAGEHVTFDYRIQRPRDGMIRWLRNTDFPITDQDGKIALIGGIGHDLTELREAELRLQVLMEGIPQLVWRAVDGGRWTWASPQWTAFTGQEEGDSHDWGWLEAVHPDDRERTSQIWAAAIERGEFRADYRVCHAGEDRYRWFQTRARPVRDASGAIIEWLGTSTDVDDLRQLQDRQEVLVGELQHRTRNLMGLVRSMANRTGEASQDLPDFRVRFQDRLEALARVQGLLSRLSATDRVAFDELIEAELQALDGSAKQVTLDGPKGIRLRSSMVQTLGMALHELATNAVKYGALSQPDARLAIRWRMDPPDRRGRPWLHIDWRESGVAMPPSGAATQGSGQGRELIEGALPYQLSAKTSFELGPDGVHCTIAIPVSARNVQMESRNG